MVNYKQMMKSLVLTKNTALALALVFCTNLTIPYAFTQAVSASSNMLAPAAKNEPVNLVGIKTYPDNPFKFDFLINNGKVKLDENQLKEESLKLARYFLAGLTTPSHDLWVNLQPGQSNRVIPNAFATTEMGEDMLAQDYILKRLAASLTYPESEIGKKYWDGINSTTSFNRIWIVPESAVIYEDGSKAYLTESKLKVMMEEDYLASRFNTSRSLSTKRIETNGPLKDQATQPFKTKILPLIEKEVNTGTHFAQLRQIYHALLLAAWYKNRLKNSPLYEIYVNKNKTSGIDFTEDNEAQEVYNKYMNNFKNGEYNYVKTNRVGASGSSLACKITRRQYFSGGASAEEIDPVAEAAMRPLPSMPPTNQLPEDARAQERLTAVVTPTTVFEIIEEALPMTELTADQRRIRNLGWCIENIGYKGSDRQFIKKYVKKLYLQNNRALNRPHPCNGHCYYCFSRDKALAEQRRQMPPPTIEEIKEITAKAISLGIKSINIAGEETFQDMESFWAIVDECKDKLVEFSLVTNGIYFLQNDPTAFFKELQKRIGKVGQVKIIISWDSQKATEYGQRIEFKRIDIKKKMRDTTAAFTAFMNAEADNFRMFIATHDNETTNRLYTRKSADAFFESITSSGDRKIAIARGEIEASTGEIARVLAHRGQLGSLQEASALVAKRPYCGSYMTKIDLSTGEFIFSESTTARQRVAINAQNMVEIFASPFRRPQGRHLYTINGILPQNKRAYELFQIAFFLRPELETTKITDMVQLENLIYSDEELLTEINLVYLLLDMIETATTSMGTRLLTALWPSTYNNTLENVPYQAAAAAANQKIIAAAIQISQYLETNNKRKTLYFLQTLSALDPNRREQKIRKDVVDKLADRGIIAFNTPQITKDFEQKPFYPPNDNLPKLSADVAKNHERFETSLTARTPKERRFALNRLGIMANEKSPIISVEAICQEHINPAMLTEQEQEELIHIFASWIIPDDNQHNITLARLIAYFTESPFISVRYSAREKIIEIKDSLPQGFYAALIEKIDQAITSPVPSATNTPQASITPTAPADTAAETQGGVNFDIENKNVIKTRGTFNNQARNKYDYPKNITGLTCQFVDFEKI